MAQKSTKQAVTKPTPPKSQIAKQKNAIAFPWLVLAGILFLTLLVYLPSNDNQFTNWDDDVYVTENSLITKPQDFQAILKTQVGGNHHPVTMYSLAMNYAYAGREPKSYHVVNLALHLMNTALVFLFIWLLSGKRFWVSVITSLFFAIHPMHVESVAWVSERKDVLYTFFFMISLIFYHKYAESQLKADETQGQSSVNWMSFLVCGLMFVLSVLSKPAAVVLPVVLLAIDYFMRRKIEMKLILEKIPLFVISAGIGIWTLDAQKASGAVDDPNRWNLFEKLVFACYGSVMYVVKMIIPTGLSAIYPYPNVEGKGIPMEFYAMVPILLVTLGIIFYLFRQNRVVIFGIAFFFINLILVLQFFTVGQAVMADRYTYVPYIGLFFTLSWWLDEKAEQNRLAKFKPAVLGLFGLLAVVCVFQTYKRCEVWKNTESLWVDTIAKFPRRVVVAYNNLGHFYRQSKQLDKALANYNEAIVLNPTYHLAWANKGNIYFDKNMNDSALACYNKALSLKDDLWETYGNRGAVKARMNDHQGGISDLNKAVALNSGYKTGFSNRALVNEMLQRYDSAKVDYQRVLDLDPRSPENHRYYNAVGVCNQHLGLFQESIEKFNSALSYKKLTTNEIGIYYLKRSYSYNSMGNKKLALPDAVQAQKMGVEVNPSYLASLQN